MRILSIGDLHGDRGLAQRLAAKAESERADIVIMCGDLTFFDQEPKGIIGPFLERNKRVLFVPGNHDSFVTAELLSRLYPIRNLHGSAVRYDDIGFFGCGKANIGFEALDEEEILLALREAHRYVQNARRRVMVTHVHPAGTLAERMTRFFHGSSGLRRAIEELQPDIAFCCHVHEAEGLEEHIGRTRLVNVGRRGFVLDI